ncbi:MAG: glycosyltransferase [Clostridiales bacterium]|nr:glycosyltransferase [Clostridiales bacterium]
MNRRPDVVIPVYKPDVRLRELLQMLLKQTVRPGRILLVNTEKELFDQHLLDDLEPVGEPCHENSASRKAGPASYVCGTDTRPVGESCHADSASVIWVEHIRRADFDHGGTRHMAASMLDGEWILFMTQDAVPANKYLIENLLHPFENPQVCAAYARQLPRKDCSLAERYSRSFNYPSRSRIKTAADLQELGIKTYFCSNVCAMYRRSTYEALGGFERHTIFNEDMIFAGRLIQDGKGVAYCADAEVIHSHNYSGAQQFHRNFDLGVSQAEHPEIFSGIRSESEGIDLVRKTAGYLIRNRKPWLLVPLVWQSGCKYIGYRLGKNYQRLPDDLVKACSMNKGYWHTQIRHNSLLD